MIKPFKVFTGAMLLLALGCLAARPAQAQFGVAAGLNFDSFGDIDLGSAEASVENATGYHIGVFYDLAAGPLAIRPGLFYRVIQDIEYELSTGNLPDNVFDLNMIEVPIDVRFRMPAPLIAPYVLAGPVFAFASSEDDDFDESLEDLTISANIGVGVELGILGVRLFPELRYSFGITPIVNDFDFLGSSVTPDDESQRLNVLMLRLGVAF